MTKAAIPVLYLTAPGKRAVYVNVTQIFTFYTDSNEAIVIRGGGGDRILVENTPDNMERLLRAGGLYE